MASVSGLTIRLGVNFEESACMTGVVIRREDKVVGDACGCSGRDANY